MFRLFSLGLAMVVRKGSFFDFRRGDYHAVPSSLAARKETVHVFHRAWSKCVGHGELNYTHTDEGRRMLLKAKTRAYSAAFAKEVRRQDKMAIGWSREDASLFGACIDYAMKPNVGYQAMAAQ